MGDAEQEVPVGTRNVGCICPRIGSAKAYVIAPGRENVISSPFSIRAARAAEFSVPQLILLHHRIV
jgi:hypothetical protein